MVCFSLSLDPEWSLTELTSEHRGFGARTPFPPRKIPMDLSSESRALLTTPISLRQRDNPRLCQPRHRRFRCDVPIELFWALHQRCTDPTNPSPYHPPDVFDANHCLVLISGRCSNLVAAVEYRRCKRYPSPSPPGRKWAYRNPPTPRVRGEVVRVLRTYLRPSTQVSESPAAGLRVQHLVSAAIPA
jgi:hypothetical protein